MTDGDQADDEQLERTPLEDYLNRMEPGAAVELHEGGCPASLADGDGWTCNSWLVMRRGPAEGRS